MKKIIALLLIAVMLFALAACGGKVDVENAITIDNFDMYNDYQDNAAAAKEKYHNKTVKMKGAVYEIYTDHVQLSKYDFVYVYLPTEDLVSLKKDDVITVVGIMKNPSGHFPEIRNAILVK